MSAPDTGAPAPPAWAELGRFLARDLLLVPAGDREEQGRTWREIVEAEARIDDRLTVGLLGGTGVGKSTLVNALAGVAISAAGERRPTTSRVIAYRHVNTALPEVLPLADISEPQVVHERSALERVIVLDFPDFDSVEELHHEVLARFCPHLDVLIVLVDDMKYADDRLYELLRRLPHARENLRPVLNKVDRLEKRYPGRWREVAREILDDFASKLETHAGMRVDRGSMLAISAQNACAAACETGDFAQLVRFLETYREEKRRRAVKELNIEARKAALAGALSEKWLAPGPAAAVARAAAGLESRWVELERALAGTPAAVLTVEERRGLVSRTLVRAAGKLGFPLDFLLTLAAQLRLRRRPSRAAAVDLSSSRLREHYKHYLQGTRNARRELRLGIEGILPTAEASARDGEDEPSSPRPFAHAGEVLQGQLTRVEDSLRRRSRLWNHAAAALVAAVGVWSVAYPAFRTAMRRFAGEEGATWRGVVKDLFLAVIESLNPITIVSFVVLIALAYVGTAIAVWVRQASRIQAAATEAEDVLRAEARRHGESLFARERGRLERWQEERAELERLVSGARAHGARAATS